MFRSTNRSLRPTGRMRWINWRLWGFSCIRDPGHRGNKITETTGFCPRCCCPETVRYQIVFAPPRKSYRTGTGLLFTHKNGCGGAISVTERSCTAPISKVESCTSDRRLHYTGYLSWRHENHILDRASVQTQERLWQSQPYDGAKLRRADLWIGDSHIGQAFTQYWIAYRGATTSYPVVLCVHSLKVRKFNLELRRRRRHPSSELI